MGSCESQTVWIVGEINFNQLETYIGSYHNQCLKDHVIFENSSTATVDAYLERIRYVKKIPITLTLLDKDYIRTPNKRVIGIYKATENCATFTDVSLVEFREM